MKRIGIMTFPNSLSYGAILQEYALAFAVRSLGYEAEVINYSNYHMSSERHLLSNRKAGLTARLKLTAKHLMHLRMNAAFRKFERGAGLYPKHTIHRTSALASMAQRYDAVICGSDQVWNPGITGSDISYFLDFCDEKTDRIAYAPSFGVTELDEGFAASAAQELQKFKAISVRETVGAELVYKLVGHKPEQVLDPTFLIPAENWRKLEKESIPGPYILYYAVRSNADMMQFAAKLAAEKRLPLMIVGGNILGAKKRGTMRYLPDRSPSEWLGLISNASCVVTNSFHGLAFSVIYHKQFFVSLSSLTNSRMKDLVSRLGLESQIVENQAEGDFNRADYTLCDALLSELKAASFEYLKKALS